jgi:hypothetical protein
VTVVPIEEQHPIYSVEEDIELWKVRRLWGWILQNSCKEWTLQNAQPWKPAWTMTFFLWIWQTATAFVTNAKLTTPVLKQNDRLYTLMKAWIFSVVTSYFTGSCYWMALPGRQTQQGRWLLAVRVDVRLFVQLLAFTWNRLV